MDQLEVLPPSPSQEHSIAMGFIHSVKNHHCTLKQIRIKIGQRLEVV